MNHEDRLVKAKEFHNQWIAAKEASLITVDSAMKAGILTDDKIKLLSSLYPAWSANISYTKGDFIIYNNILYEILATHVSIEGKTPDVTTTLYKIKTK